MAVSELEDLLQGARSQGSLDSAGSFTIDFATAISKWWSSGAPAISVRPRSRSFARSVPKKHHACEIRVRHGPEDLNGVGLTESRASCFLRMGVAGRSAYPEACYLALGVQIVPESPSTARLIYAGETLQTFPIQLSSCS